VVVWRFEASVRWLAGDKMQGKGNCTFHAIKCPSFGLAVLLGYPVADVQAVVCFLVRVDPAFYHWGRHGVDWGLEDNSTTKSGEDTTTTMATVWEKSSRGSENSLKVRFVGLDWRCKRRTSDPALDVVWWAQTVSGRSRRIALYLASALHLFTSTFQRPLLSHAQHAQNDLDQLAISF
jgi:hypothetical protein